MRLTRRRREQLCKLSMLAYGKKYEWLRILEKGLWFRDKETAAPLIELQAKQYEHNKILADKKGCEAKRPRPITAQKRAFPSLRGVIKAMIQIIRTKIKQSKEEKEKQNVGEQVSTANTNTDLGGDSDIATGFNIKVGSNETAGNKI